MELLPVVTVGMKSGEFLKGKTELGNWRTSACLLAKQWIKPLFQVMETIFVADLPVVKVAVTSLPMQIIIFCLIP